MSQYETPEDLKKNIDRDVQEVHGGVKGSVTISDAFYPETDGILIALDNGSEAVLQPGGSIKDYQIIDLCNRTEATMVFTEQRSFKH